MMLTLQEDSTLGMVCSRHRSYSKKLIKDYISENTQPFQPIRIGEQKMQNTYINDLWFLIKILCPPTTTTTAKYTKVH